MVMGIWWLINIGIGIINGVMMSKSTVRGE